MESREGVSFMQLPWRDPTYDLCAGASGDCRQGKDAPDAFCMGMHSGPVS